ncbi:MAG: HAMP domain-containing protein [Candidatus Omnitrophica bacterium]|nr:HAMP domain-containing protein [Candidatus Omnitrophota bacterium]
MEKGAVAMVSAKRKRYFIKRDFQIRYAAIIAGFILLSAIISSITTYLAVFPYLSEKLANVYPQGRLMAVLKNANMKALLSTVVVVPFIAWFSLFLSHRIAGPWHRLEMTLNDMARGNFSYDIKLRKGDELQSLAESINRVIVSIRAKNSEYTASISSLTEELQVLEAEVKREPPDIMKINLLMSKMHEALKEFKSP